MKLNINTDAIVIHTNKLEKLSRSALPNAVRGTLNSLAFDVKSNTMPRSATRFNKRKKNFFKSQSTVKMAKGFNVSSMESTVGFMSKSKKSGGAVDDLEAQEHGGIIRNREYIPVKTARTGKSNKRMVQKRNRLGNIRNLVHANKMGSKNQGSNFAMAVRRAGKGGFVQSKLKGKDVTMVWRVDSTIRKKNGNFKITPVYIVNKSKTVKA